MVDEATSLSELVNQLIPAMSCVGEVLVIFDDADYLEEMCKNLLGSSISGYNLSENTTRYIWQGEVKNAHNYVASMIVPVENVAVVVGRLYAEINKKWLTPLIQVRPCFVTQGFYQYVMENGKTKA